MPNDKYLLDNVYLLNLDSRKDRLALMDYKLNELGISYKRISAILGSNYKNDYDKYIKHVKNKIKDKKYIVNSLGAYGILLTYKNIISPLGFKLNNHIIVFEDDICFHHNFKNELLKYNELINKNDVVWLGSQVFKWTKKMNENINKNGYHNVVLRNKQQHKRFLVCGAYCMVFSPRFLRILKENIDNDFDTVRIKNFDLYIVDLLFKYKNLNSCVIKPDLVMPQIFESDNMGPRNIDDIIEERKWVPSLYKYNDATAHFASIYNMVTNRGLSLRNIKNNLYADITNMKLSKIIEQNNKSFVFIITSFNNEEWVHKNLTSIINQKYPFWRIIYVNDSSTDRTLECVNNFVKEHNIGNRITIIETEQQMRQSYCRFMASKLCFNDEICCMLDGDDWLVDDCNILSKLNNLYKTHNLLMSYGQFFYYTGENDNMKLSGTSKYTKQEISNTKYRHKWITQHLRTVEASLLKTIPEKYLKINGEWLNCCTDLAEMYWCLELSQGRHMNVGFPTVVYNKQASLRYNNSYYNKDKDENEKIYRDNVESYLKNYKDTVREKITATEPVKKFVTTNNRNIIKKYCKEIQIKKKSEQQDVRLLFRTRVRKRVKQIAKNKGILDKTKIRKIRKRLHNKLADKKQNDIKNVSKKCRELINHKIINVNYDRYSNPVRLKIINNTNDFLEIN